MNRKAVALVSGGLDSALAVRVMQEQGIEVEGLNIRLPFDCCRLQAAKMAADLGIRITVCRAGDDYYGMLRKPRYRYGKGANPCTDCRIYLLRMARRFMEQVGASFVVTGEILGQRPNSQMWNQLRIVGKRSGLEGFLLRPLSARLLPPTVPEQTGIVDRERLYGFQGRSRKPLIELGHHLGLRTIPQSTGGCPLAEIGFGRKVFDLMGHAPDASGWDFELLSVGRHLRLSETTKAVVGRNEQENHLLLEFAQRAPRPEVIYVRPKQFHGAHGLIVGPADRDTARWVASVLAGYSRQFDPGRHEYEYGIPSRGMTPLAGIQPERPKAVRHLMVGAVGFQA